MTAKLSSADSDTAHDLCLIADTDLAKFNPRAENRRKIFYQFTEIDTSVRRKIKEQFIIVKRILCFYKFHIQFMFCYFFQTDLKRFFLFFTVF